MIDHQRVLTNLQLLRFQLEALAMDAKPEKVRISQERCSIAMKLIQQIENELKGEKRDQNTVNSAVAKVTSGSTD